MRPAIRQRWVVVGVAALIVAGVGVTLANQSAASDVTAPRTTTVKVVTRDLTKSLTATGTVQYSDQRAIPYLNTPATPRSANADTGSSPGAPSGQTTQGQAGGSTTASTTPRTTTSSSSAGSSSAGGRSTGTSQPSATQGGGNQGAGAPGSATQGAADQGQATTTSTRPPTTTTTAPPTTTTTTTSPSTSSSPAGSPTSGGALASSGQGGTRHVLTWMPALGSTVGLNEILFRVDNQPTILFFGVVPTYRQIDGSSTPGLDISQLQKNLVDLGFGDGVSVTGIYDTATYYAVARWETSQGLDGDGIVQLGEVAYALGRARITGEPTAVGSEVQSGASIVTASSITKVVATTVDARQVDTVKVGQPVDVKLPDQRVVSGQVSDIGTVATATGGTASNASGPTPATLPVTVGFDDPAISDSLPDDAQVAVAIRVDERKAVVAVPPAALLAGPDGKPSVTLTDTGERVAVRPGLAADGMVELSDPPASLRDGVSVSIPS